MAEIRPFVSIRPQRGKAAEIAALPYDVYNREEATKEVERHPQSFLSIDRAETQFPLSVDMYDDKVYERAHDTLWQWVEDGTFLTEDKKCYYLYELTMNGRVQTGVAACASIDDYENGVIKKHENTRAEKEVDRIRHVDVCDANTGPIYLACEYTNTLTELLESWKKEHLAVYDFTEEDEITHRVWVIDQETVISRIQKEMEQIPALYIADGHHRAASAVKVGLKRREEHPDYTGEEEFNYFLSVVFPYDQLTILAYNRVVKDLNGQTPDEVLSKIKENFDMTIVPGFPAKPVEKHGFGLYLDGFWYLLKAKPQLYEGKDVVGQLDCQILQEKILEPVLGISDPRVDKRITFVGGSHKLRELQAMADVTGGIAFALYPTSMEDLMQIADENKLMPPKSTWFEPKLRSGIFIHKLKRI